MKWIHQGVQWLGGVIVRGAVKVKMSRSSIDEYVIHIMYGQNGNAKNLA